MNFGLVVGLTLFMILFGWLGYLPLKKNLKKEKNYYLLLMVVSWLIAVLLIYFPDMSGPTELVNWIYSPLTKLVD